MLIVIFNASWQYRIQQMFPLYLWFRSCQIKIKNSSCQVQLKALRRIVKLVFFMNFGHKRTFVFSCNMLFTLSVLQCLFWAWNSSLMMGIAKLDLSVRRKQQFSHLYQKKVWSNNVPWVGNVSRLETWYCIHQWSFTTPKYTTYTNYYHIKSWNYELTWLIFLTSTE